MSKTNQTLAVIKKALVIGYRVDPELGLIYGKGGRPLTLTKCASIRYPQVSLHVPGLSTTRKNDTYAIAAHRMMAYVIWGDEAFKPGVQVRHLNGVMDIRKESLTLGTCKENMSDISPAVRSKAAKHARAAQGTRPSNAKFSDEQIQFIRSTVRRLKGGGLAPGELERLAKKFQVSKSVISGILRNVTYVTDHNKPK